MAKRAGARARRRPSWPTRNSQHQPNGRCSPALTATRRRICSVRRPSGPWLRTSHDLCLSAAPAVSTEEAVAPAAFRNGCSALAAASLRKSTSFKRCPARCGNETSGYLHTTSRPRPLHQSCLRGLGPSAWMVDGPFAWLPYCCPSLNISLHPRRAAFLSFFILSLVSTRLSFLLLAGRVHSRALHCLSLSSIIPDRTTSYYTNALHFATCHDRRRCRRLGPRRWPRGRPQALRPECHCRPEGQEHFRWRLRPPARRARRCSCQAPGCWRHRWPVWRGLWILQ